MKDKNSQNERVTRGIQILTGDPKKAIVKLSIPMMLAMFVQTLYNLVDGIWVAGLGPEALAAIGLFFPVFMIVIALSAGLGVGVSSAISRRIGAKDKNGANIAAEHGILLALASGVVIAVLGLVVIDEVLGMIGATGKSLELSIVYARILLLGSILLTFNNVANGILRGEGDTKRAMYAMTIGSVINMILDPVFIYIMKLGVAGAAYATVISMAITSSLLLYWLFAKKDTYVSINLKKFKFNLEMTKDILRVGLPSSLAQISMSVAIFVLNSFAVKEGGDFGIAVFTSAWRVINFGTVPLIGMATAVTAVTGAAFGAKDGEKLETAHLYAVKLGLILGFSVMAIILIFAPFIAKIFTYSEGGASIYKELMIALRVLSVFLPGVPLGMLTSSMFQGIGQGGKSLAVTILRTVIMQLIFAWFFTRIIDLGLAGVWWGIVIGNATAANITFQWGRHTVKKIKCEFSKALSSSQEVTC